MPAGIYAIVHRATGRAYIGSSVCHRARWRKHRNMLRKGAHPSRYLQSAWAKYGESAFAFEVLERVADKSKLVEREQVYIDALGHFNIRKKAESNLGLRHGPMPAARRAKIGMASGRARRGMKFTAEHREALSRAHRGRRQTPEVNAQHKSRCNARAARYEHDGESKSLRDWAVACGINFKTLKTRVQRGTPLDEALTRPVATKHARRKHT